MNTQTKPQGRRLSREKWLQHALDVLKQDGVAGVRVERLSRDLGVTKGSFYHHFRDRSDLLREMLDFWHADLTARAVESMTAKDISAPDKLFALMQMINDEDLARYDVAIRAWASFDPMAAQAVEEVDRTRFKFVNSLFKACGFKGAEGEMRARLYMNYMVAEPSILFRETKRKRQRTLKLSHQLLTQVSGT